MNGRIYHLAAHESRANHSRQSIFGQNIPPLHLAKNIIIPKKYQQGLVKCRVIYDEKIHEISYENYTFRKIESLKIIQNDDIEYPHKYLVRTRLDELYHLREHHDEIIIVKNGLVSDAYYYNILCLKGKNYFTPASPLLYGVCRTQLIKNNQIKAVTLTIQELKQSDSIHLINAMTPPGQIVINPSNIF